MKNAYTCFRRLENTSNSDEWVDIGICACAPTGS